MQHYAIPGSSYKELDTKISSLEIPLADNDLGLPIPDLIIDCQKPWAGLQRGINAVACHRDNNYLATYPNFKLPPGGDDFVIVYGVNHQATGKVAYGSFSLYVDAVRWLGIGTKTSQNFDDADGSGPLTGEPGDSARYYLGDDPDAQYLYAWKVARHCNEGEPFCMEIADPVEFERPDGSTYTCKYVDPELFPGSSGRPWSRRDCGCEGVQGFLICPPVNSVILSEFIKNDKFLAVLKNVGIRV